MQIVGTAPGVAKPSFTITDAHGATLSVDYELPLLALTRGTLRWKTPLAGLRVKLTGALAKPDFDPCQAARWRRTSLLELSRVSPFPAALLTYYAGQVPALTCSATGRTCKGTVTGTIPSGKAKLGLRLKRGRATGEWSFRVSVSDDPLLALSSSDQTVRLWLCRSAGRSASSPSTRSRGRARPRCAIDLRTRRTHHPAGSFRAS